MNKVTKQVDGRRGERYQWVLEVLILVTVTPALVFAVTSLQGLPIA
jgi:hypothetical protein